MRNEMMPSGSEGEPEKIPSDLESTEKEALHYMDFASVLNKVKKDPRSKKILNNEQALHERAVAMQQVMDQMTKQPEFAHLLQSPEAIYTIASTSTKKLSPEEQAEFDRFDPDLNR